MVMYAPYRCCECPEEAKCCALWCSCPDEITVSFCKKERIKEVYACQESFECHPGGGELIGTYYSSVHVTGVKFRKVGPGLQGFCSGCCFYEVVTGPEQTGTVLFTRDSYLLWCVDEECNRGYITCVGTYPGPLSGSSGNWALNTFSGYLKVECCPGATCFETAYKAELRIAIQGVDSNAGLQTDCCTQLSTPSGMVVDLIFGHRWECQDRSRWEGTCPGDLNDLDGSAFVEYWGVNDCDVTIGNSSCPCTGGNPTDYASVCFDGIFSGRVSWCSERSETGVGCAPSIS